MKPTNEKDHYIDVNGINTHYIEQGSKTKEPLLFIHGAFSSTLAWDDLFPLLENEFHLYALDLISHGYTERIIRETITIDTVIDHLLGFMDNTGLGKPVIIGNSLGCMIATYFAFKHPDRVKALILLDGGLSVSPIPVKEIKGAPQLAAMGITKHVGDAVFPIIGKKMIKDWYKMCTHEANRHILTKERIRNNYAPLRDMKKSIKALNILLRTLFKLGDPKEYAQLEVESNLKSLTLPVDLVWGDSDHILPQWIGEEMLAHAPSCKMEIIEKCGHLPHEELPEKTAQLIRGYIKTL